MNEGIPALQGPRIARSECVGPLTCLATRRSERGPSLPCVAEVLFDPYLVPQASVMLVKI